MRISKRKQEFEKGYLPGWSEEIFVISKKFPTTPVTYANRIQLDGDWEVALSEILFQRTWYNIQEDECMLRTITPGSEIDLFLPEGFYSDVYQLVDRCNRMMERNLKDVGTIVDTKLSTLNLHTMLLREKSAYYQCRSQSGVLLSIFWQNKIRRYGN